MRKYRFKAKIKAGDGGGAYVWFPFDVEKEFGAKGKIPMQARLNGVPYTGTLIKYGNPLHMLPMPKAIRQQTGTAPGDTVDVELWKDEEPRVIEVPADLKEALKKTRCGAALRSPKLHPSERVLPLDHRSQEERNPDEASRESR